MNALAMRAATASLEDASYETATRAQITAERALWTRAFDALKAIFS